MKDEPMDKEDILKKLSEIHKLDYDYADGRILGSMCTQAHPFAKEVYCKFLDTNLGDPGLFKGTKYLEDEVVRSIGNLLSLDEAYGNIVTGGTEANIMAVRAARDMLNLKIVEVNLDENYKMDVESVKESVSDKTVAIVAIAGTTELGLIDPIGEISKIAHENNIYFHVDAAFGGFSIPFLRDAGYDLPVFDFSLEGVCSITVDPHKMGLAPIPAGGIIFRKKEYLQVMAVDSPYLTVKTQSTIVGTRIGAASAATYAIINYFGKKGYSQLAQELMDNTYYLKDGLQEIGYEIVCEPELNLLAFNHPNIKPRDFAEKLEKLGWNVSVAKCPIEAIRVVLMNHIKKRHIKELLEDLKEIY